MFLIPCKFLANWQGPYTILQRVGLVNYWLQPGKHADTQLNHININMVASSAGCGCICFCCHRCPQVHPGWGEEKRFHRPSGKTLQSSLTSSPTSSHLPWDSHNWPNLKFKTFTGWWFASSHTGSWKPIVKRFIPSLNWMTLWRSWESPLRLHPQSHQRLLAGSPIPGCHAQDCLHHLWGPLAVSGSSLWPP